MQIQSNGLTFEVESKGSKNAPAVLLTMGLGMQLTAWPEALVDALLDAGYRVICYDNRDIGLSSHLDHLGLPNMMWALLKAKLGLAIRAPYPLQDMANDALGILDAMGVKQAHVIGVTMGGMISQRIAITAPDRIFSLTSVMSSSGAPRLPEARPEVVRAMLARPKSTRVEDIVDHTVRLFKLIGSPGFAQDEAQMRERFKKAVLRAYHPVGVSRQLLAIVSDTKRYRSLSDIQCPSLVIHGTDDPLVPMACGKDTAHRIKNARFVPIQGMGHDWPPGVTDLLCAHIVPHLKQASARS